MLKCRGFTLIELLVVMGIILVLMAIAIPGVNNARMKAKSTEVKSNCNTIVTKLEQYGVDHTGFYPGAHYVQNGANYYSGPGVIGGLPTYDGTVPRKDFFVAKPGTADSRGPDNAGPELAPGVANPLTVDALVEGGYVEDYPANPFLRASSGVKAQMSNLFLFHPMLSSSAGGAVFPTQANRLTLDWNRYTNTGESMRATYEDFGRGHFTYVPLNPVNNAGVDFQGSWGTLTDAARAEFYKRCRGYMLVGWGASRADDSMAKGLSEKYWRSDLNGTGGFDFDADGKVDLLESFMTDATFLTPEMQDSSGATGSFGAATFGAGRDLDPLFNGAAFIKVTGS